MQVGEAACFQRRLASGFVLDAGDEYHRERHSGTRQFAAHVDPGHALQIDVQNKARCIAQPSAAEKAFHRVEDLSIEAMRLQHALDCPKNAGVIVEDGYQFATGHG